MDPNIDIRQTVSWKSDVRSPHDTLGGVKMLAREVDKVRAELEGSTTGEPHVHELLLDKAFFSSLGSSKEALADVVRGAWAACRNRNLAALSDLRESVENEPEISDAQFMANAQASDIDDAVVRWVFGTLHATADVIAAVNSEVERIAPLG